MVRESLNEFMEIIEVYGVDFMVKDIIRWEDADFRDRLAEIYIDYLEEPKEGNIWEEMAEFNNGEEWAIRFLMAMGEDSRRKLLDRVIGLYGLSL